MAAQRRQGWEMMQDRQASTSKGAWRPTFLFGMERSGTTLLSMMVGAHPQIAVPLATTGLWLDFAEGMGSSRDAVRKAAPARATQAMIARFRSIASSRPPLAALGAFYAYESQVARIAGLKAQGLRELYAADEKTCAYFALHSTWDVHHSEVWAREINNGLDLSGAEAEEIVRAVEDTALAMWNTLDGIYEQCDCSCN